MNLRETKQLLMVITDTFQSTRFSRTAADTWHAVLAPYPFEMVMKCYNDLAYRQTDFPPSAYAIAAACNALLSPQSEPEALWGAIQGIVRQVGNPDHQTRALRLVEAIDRDAAEVVRIIGWWPIATADEFNRQHQFRLFKSLLSDLRAGRSLPEALTEATIVVGPAALNEAAIRVLTDGWRQAGDTPGPED